MKLEQSKNFNSNYACKFVEITNLRKHSNADRLQITTIDGNNIIVGLNTKVGDVLLYFPVECAIESWFLAENNLYRVFKDENLNIDKDAAGGFFEKHGRVRAMVLRGERSEGYLDVYTSAEVITKDEIGVEFDTIDGKLLAKKYVPKISLNKGTGGGKKSKKSETRFNRIIDEQFRYHIDTGQFAKNVHRFQLDDLVSVTSKLHGTSAIYSNVLTKRELNWFEKILQKLGVQIVDTKYDVLYSSRKVIKNKFYNKEVQPGYYNTDVWESHYQKLKDIIDKGITLYGEIVGYADNSGKMIQKGFDYGCQPGTSEFYLYRVTYTNVDGKVFEFSARQVQQYANKYGIKAVPEVFYGRWSEFMGSQFKDQYNYCTDDRDRELIDIDLVDSFREQYLEGDDPMCITKAPYEGIVIRREIDGIEPYKFKSFRFLKKESEMLDSGEVDMETAESGVE